MPNGHRYGLTMAEPIVIVGTGGSGRETYALLTDIMQAAPNTWEFKGFLGLHEPPTGLLERLQVPFLGDPHTLTERIPNAHAWSYALAIGKPEHRRAMDSCLTDQGLTPATLIHPSVLIGPDVEIGNGAVICAHTVITTNVRIGMSAQINIGCVIAHDARIGDYVTFAQGVNISGNVTILDGATLFTRCAVTPGHVIGSAATVGAGAMVIADVPAQTTVAGVPARPLP
jgi:sugar O-acyltransferase (sialic acid O-acetyltransferase NeuD family)